MKKIVSILILAAVLIMSASINISASVKLTDGVSILNPKKNVHGQGYEWDNINDILTLDNVYIDTDDEFGLKISDGATVILKGTNRIKASSVALYLGGKVIFKGSGKLVLEAETGVLCNSPDKTDTVSIIGGKYEITASKDGFSSKNQNVLMSGAEMTVKAGNLSFDVPNIMISNGMKLTCNAGIEAQNSFSIEAANVKIDTLNGKPAITAGGKLSIDRVNLSAGNSSLTEVDKYDGQTSIETKSNWKYIKSSILFGENVSFVVDVIIFVLLFALILVLILLPKYLKKKKLAKIQANM